MLLIKDFDSLSTWEKGNVIYELSSIVSKKVTALASYYWGIARMEERLEPLAKNE